LGGQPLSSVQTVGDVYLDVGDVYLDDDKCVALTVNIMACIFSIRGRQNNPAGRDPFSLEIGS